MKDKKCQCSSPGYAPGVLPENFTGTVKCAYCDGLITIPDKRIAKQPSQELLDRKMTEWKKEDAEERRLCTCSGKPTSDGKRCSVCGGLKPQAAPIPVKKAPRLSLEERVAAIELRLEALEGRSV